MCTKQRWIWNRYARKNVLVKCGKCEACLQEKACLRSNRIRNNVCSGEVCLFITLTYAPQYLPYIKKSELKDAIDFDNNFDVCIYRDADVYVRSQGGRFVRRAEVGTRVLFSVFVDWDYRKRNDVAALRSARGLSSDKVGVCYNPDFQNFIKRLKVNVQRHYGKDPTKLSYFYCSELGGYTERPHFHALLFIPSDDEEEYRRAVVEAWPYADSYRTEKYVELARDAASYVSSYVNCVSRSKPLFTLHVFKPSHHYSKAFGTRLDCFSLPSLLEKKRRGDMFYYIERKGDAVRSVAPLPIPEYVVNRFFPKFVGVSAISLHALERILLQPADVGFILKKGWLDNPVYDIHPKQLYSVYVRLENCYEYYHKVTGKSRFDYMIDYKEIWNAHFAAVMRFIHDDTLHVIDYENFYSNAIDVYESRVNAPTLSQLDMQVNPNLITFVLLQDSKYKELFYKLDKQKVVTNFCMSENGHCV